MQSLTRHSSGVTRFWCQILASTSPSNRASLSAAAAAKGAKGAGPKPREPAKVRSDNAPLYKQMQQERRATAERVALEKRRADLRRQNFDDSLQQARAKRVELPSNCLAWQQYALFANLPTIRPLKSGDDTEDGPSFASLLRSSSFIDLGNFENRIVIGRIFERYENNLYVDFGAKFHAVCPAPRVNNEKYVRGAQVLLRLIDPEMTSKFLGSESHVTLGEADAVLLGLRPAQPGDEAELIASSAAEQLDDGEQRQLEDGGRGVPADTVSPLRLSLLRPVLLEQEAAAFAAEDASAAAAASAAGDLSGFGDDFNSGGPLY